MRKIIGFRLEIKSREISRRAKKSGLDLAAVGFDEAAINLLIAKAMKAISPAVLFDTFPPTDPDSQGLSSMPGLAYSVVLATLGSGFTELRKKSFLENPAESALWGLIEELALDESLRFAAALINDEAEKDACELSPTTKITDGAALQKLFTKIDASKINVTLPEGALSPKSSMAASLSWLAKSKAKGKAK